MSNLNLSGKDVLQFLLWHYDFVQSVFHVSKPDFVIEAEKLEALIAEYNNRGERKISLNKLVVDLKFCRSISADEFRISSSFTNFLEFIFDDFVLDLPETLRLRHQAVYNHFTALQTEQAEAKVITLIHEIVKVVEEFQNDIERQTSRLLRDTEALKSSAEDHADLTLRLQKAGYWIDEYIMPLNAILNDGHPASIVNSIVEVRRYAGEKKLLAESYEVRREFEKLYACTVNAKIELDKTLSKLTRELLPLLERIRGNSLILSGFYHFVEHVDEPSVYEISLPALLRRTKAVVVSKNFASDAEFYIDQFAHQNTETEYDVNTEEEEWLPSTVYFKDRLLQAKQVDNFYQWCFDVLGEHTQAITLSKFFSVSNLLLEEDVVAEYNEAERFELQLVNATLVMPKIKAYAKLPH